ncbi:hypothetical protein Daes_0405 [Pseudodesulfovibrio aespoeensis Aspo-2]|uniref:Integrase catalytic region n=1 Tax=Pseudodesulfovibrio aespoeensis (strain ATCC 700646 / DSM 10631 / Aspo-2) TaxID=643562 RepID=E6VX23_PSEA9|nr:hypothetical protein Daes_0405 [Pseudodesulfovibrio aespoeensis Aspo-2]
MEMSKTIKLSPALKENLMSSFNHNVIKHKVGLLNLTEELDNVSKACRLMGFSRGTFYRYQAAKEEGGVEALLDN